ncbi:MAG: M14 family zinc carboxypeptidase, partial [Thermoplasmatota archaeon]
YEGRHIYAMKISDNVLNDEDEPNFLMVSCHHAREIVTPVIALYSISQFTTNYGIDPVITEIVNNYEIWISPVWNVDGYEYVYNVDNYWRKNRHPYPPGIGVDLNRNYPFGWYSSGSGSTDPTSETYKGPYPASEIETQTMMIFGKDRHFAKVLDYHSYGREVLFGYLSLYHPFQSFLQAEAVQLSIASGYGGAVRVPSADGENYQWHLAYNGSYANLIETHTDFQPSYSSAISEAQLVWPGVIWMLQRPITISGHVVDSITQKPLVAEIKLKNVNFQNGEHFFSEPRFGRYHLFLPSGTYTIEFSCENYINKALEVTVNQTSALILDVQLERLNENPNKPVINGPTVGNPGIEYEYTFNATDPDGDTLEYYINWGDGDITG